MRTFIVAATSKDGFLGKDAGHNSFTWTSKEDKERFKEMTKKAGLVIVGSKTYETFPPKFRPLPERQNVVYSHSKKYEGSGVETTSEDPEALLQRLAQQGQAEAAVIGGGEVYRMFLDAGLVDAVYLTVEPIEFGTGVPFWTKEQEKGFRIAEDRTLGSGTRFVTYAKA